MSNKAQICPCCHFKNSKTPIMRMKIEIATIRLHYLASVAELYKDISKSYNKGYYSLDDDFFNTKCPKCKHYYFDMHAYMNSLEVPPRVRKVYDKEYIKTMACAYTTFDSLKFTPYSKYMRDVMDFVFFDDILNSKYLDSY